MILVIALNTFREVYRNKFFVSLFFISLMFIMFSLILGELTFEEQFKIMFDVGFASIHIFLIISSIFLGSFLVIRELESQTYQTLLTTPLTRNQFLIGKFIGLNLINLLMLIILTFCLYLLLSLIGKFSAINFSVICLLLFFESSLLICGAFLFSLLFSPFVSIFISMSLYFIGHWIEELNYFSTQSNSIFYKQLSSVVNFIVPHLYETNYRFLDYMFTTNINFVDLNFILIHIVMWIITFLILSSIVFSKKSL